MNKKRVISRLKYKENHLLMNLIFFVIFLIVLAIGVKFIFLNTTTPITGYWSKVGNEYNCSSCSDCTDAVNNASAGDIIYLNTSLSGVSGSCINFFYKDNIVFDCQNNYIQGDWADIDYGIYLNYTDTDGSDNNTIRNCNVTGFTEGVFLWKSNNNILTNITTNDNRDRGINIYSSSNNTLTNITSSNNYESGIFFSSGDNSTLTNIITNNNINQYGISFSSSNNNIFTNITTNLNHKDGIYLSSNSNNNTFNYMTASNNSQKGIFLDSSISNITLTNITANNNNNGIYITYSDNNILTNVEVMENTQQDIYFYTNLDSDCSNNLTNVTGSGGRAIEFYNYSTTIQNKELSELILCNADNLTINNVTIRGSDTKNNNGVFICITANSKISNIDSSENYQGLYISPDFYNNTLINITTNNNSDYGIYLGESGNNTLTGVTSNYNGYGISFYSSFNNTLTNIIITNSQYGIFFEQDGDYNIINDSKIENNSIGIYLQSGGSPDDNKIYNNIFNNTVNYYSSATLTNYFNTTKTAGTNIVGGPWIGGNYWDNYSNPGTGFSETCTDSDEDKICDSAYNVDSEEQSYDYLPLVFVTLERGCTENWTCTTWSACAGGTQTRTCTDSNNCGTIVNKPTESQSCTIGTSPGGLPKNKTTEKHTFININPNQSVEVNINIPGLDIIKISFTANKSVSSASIIIGIIEEIANLISNEDFAIGTPPESSYQGFEINATNINSTNIANVTINFKINKIWVQDNNLDYNTVILYRKPDTADRWDALNTNLTSEDSEYYYFSASSPEFSTFVIFIGTQQCEPGALRCFDNNVQLCLGNYTWVITKVCKEGCENANCIGGEREGIFSTTPGSIALYIIISILSAGIIVILYFMFRYLSKKR